VAAGTCVEYAPADTPLAEATAVLEPTTPYGRAILAFRTALVEASIQHGFSAAWGRVFHLFGPHEQPARLVPAAITSLLAGRPFDATAGSQIRDYSSVVDVAAAFAAVLDSTLTGDVNVASGTATSVARVLQIVGEPGTPAICTQGKVIPNLIDWWCSREGITPDRSRNRKGSTWVLSLDQGRLVAADHLASPLAAEV
jgi:nucleoside-diphosphate-sugar epimerase